MLLFMFITRAELVFDSEDDSLFCNQTIVITKRLIFRVNN